MLADSTVPFEWLVYESHYPNYQSDQINGLNWIKKTFEVTESPLE